MSIPKGQIPSNVLATNTVEAYLKFMADAVRRANDHWDHFGKAVSAAYAKAYDDNGRVLQQVHDLQVARKAADDAIMSFTLSLLTVGVAGAVAGGLINISKSTAAETAARDMVKQVLKTGGGVGIDAAVNALSPDQIAGQSVFAPANITPTEYMAKILEGISYNKGLLEDVLYELNYNPSAGEVVVPDAGHVLLNRSGDGQITVNTARFLAEIITGTSFIQQMPPMSVNSDALTPKARLALWIGWALNRDPKYWADGDQVFDQYITAGPGGGGGSNRPSKATEEQIDWEPVRQDLLRLKIPAWLITSTWRTHVWTGDSVKTGLYMWGFMDWAASKSSLDMLLDDSVRTSDTSSVQMVYARKGRRALVSNPPQWVQLGDPIVTPI